MANPDLQIRGGGGEGGLVSKKSFGPSSLGLVENDGGLGPPAPSPGSATGMVQELM